MACLIVVRRSTVYRNFSGNSARPRETRQVTSRNNFYDSEGDVGKFLRKSSAEFPVPAPHASNIPPWTRAVNYALLLAPNCTRGGTTFG